MAQPKFSLANPIKPAANIDTTIYTCPASRRTVISTFSATEVNGVATTFRVHVRRAAAGPPAAAASNARAYDTAIDANDQVGFTQGWTLDAGDIISCSSVTGNVVFSIDGEETDVPAA